MKKALQFMFFLSFVIILSIGLISANTLVGGKVYSSDYSSTISGTTINVDCDLDLKSTTSLGDGTFAIVFGADSCTTIKVTAESDYKTIYISKVVSDDTPVIVIEKDNEKHGTTGGTTRHYYNCGNGVCDAGETSSTCLSDCPVVEVINLSDNTTTEEPTEEPAITEDTNNAPITGAVTGLGGFLKTTLGTIILIFIIVVLVGGLLLIIFKKKKAKQ
jgi:hypothetical protein